MAKSTRKTMFTTIAIDQETNKLVEKICKRYSLKKGEITKLAFQYMEKANINPSEAPESTKVELKKINKRQDDIIRFIRHYEEEQLNPMIRTSNSIAVRFDGVVKALETLIISYFETNREKQSSLLQRLSEQFGKHAEVISTQSKNINVLYQIQKQGNKKLLDLIVLYAELSACGVMESRKKESLKADINKLINTE